VVVYARPIRQRVNLANNVEDSPWSTRIYQPLTDWARYIRFSLYSQPQEMRRSDVYLSNTNTAQWNGNGGYADWSQGPESSGRPSYTALSYAWDSPEESQYIIMVNSEPFPVLRNLRDFLQEIRNSSFSSYLWIDAICTYSDRSRIKHFRNLRCFFPHLEEPNLDLFWSTETLSSVIVECTRFLPIIYSHVNAIPAL
jgi:hypothetical protein